MLAALVQNGVMAVEGKHFSGVVPCPSCGGEVSGYDERERRFATIIDGDTTREVTVTVTRFQCRQCGEICSARAPFYPDTRLGSPIVDLCVTGAKELPCNQVAGILREFGLVVDRGTVRNYAGRDFGTIPVTEPLRPPDPAVGPFPLDVCGQDRWAVITSHRMRDIQTPS